MLGSETTGRKVGNQRFGNRLFRKAPFSKPRNYGRNQAQIAAEGIDWGGWRRRRDSNPRDGFPPTPLAGERLRPLGHVSEVASSRNKTRITSRICLQSRFVGRLPLWMMRSLCQHCEIARIKLEQKVNINMDSVCRVWACCVCRKLWRGRGKGPA